MAMPTVALEIKLVQEQLKAQARKEIEGAWRVAARTRLNRILSAQENKQLIAEINKLFFGREEWLKQKREALVRIKNRALTVEEETAINTEVNQLLKDAPVFISEFKYEADALSESQQPFGSDPSFNAVQGFFSKISGFLENTPFSFLGKLIEFVFGLFAKFMPAVKELGEKLNPIKTVADWFNEGHYDEADVELRKEEAQLLSKMENALVEMRNTASPEDIQAVQTLLSRFREILLEIENEEFLMAARDGTYWQDNVKFRMTLFEKYSLKSKELLEIHTQKQALTQKIEAVQKVQNLLNQQSHVAPPNTPEQLILASRLKGLEAAIAQLEPKWELLRDNENQCLQGLPAQFTNDDMKLIIDQHMQKFEAEKTRQASFRPRA